MKLRFLLAAALAVPCLRAAHANVLFAKPISICGKIVSVRPASFFRTKVLFEGDVGTFAVLGGRGVLTTAMSAGSTVCLTSLPIVNPKPNWDFSISSIQL